MPQMLTYLKQLTGIDEVKPFECVGTIDEVNAALQIFIDQRMHEKLPLLIDYYSNTTNFPKYSPVLAKTILAEFNTEHFLESRFLQIIQKGLK